MAAPKVSPHDRDLIRIATFILFDAAVFHDALAGVNSTIPPLRRATKPLQGFLDDAWKGILTIDYAPVFEIAREVLLSFPNSPDTEAILEGVVDTATTVGATGVLTRHDFMGRVYHKLLLRTTGRFYATYYTSIPAAWLLANLALKSHHPSWKFDGVPAVGEFRVLDPACGSGTLLSAAYMALKDLYILARPPALGLDQLHRVLVERVLNGWDVLDYAAHLTLTTLALHANTSVINESRVFTLPVGVVKGIPHLGSLDLLKRQTTLMGHGFGGTIARKGMGESRELLAVEAPDCDLVIMNPPFSRSANPKVKFGYSTPGEKKALDEALAHLTREMGKSGIGQAGLGAYFMLLALDVAKPNGRLAVVLPRSMLSGVSWSQVRDDFFRRCEIEYIVSNFDPGAKARKLEGWSWSENTDLGEVLIVARKTDTVLEDRRVTYINLWRKPSNEVEALLVSHQAIAGRAGASASLTDGTWQPIKAQGKTVGATYDVPQRLLERNWVSPCVFANPVLNELTLKVLLTDWPKRALGDVASSLGRDIKQVKDNFERSDVATRHVMLWGHQSAMNTMALKSKHLGHGRPKRGTGSQSLYAYATDLLLAERPHLSTECLLATLTAKPVLTTAFWEIQLPDDSWKPSVIMWFNSTYGILSFLAHSTSSQGDIFKTKKDQLVAIPIPDPSLLDHEECAVLWNEVKSESLWSFGDEWDRACRGEGIRYRLDEYWARELGLSPIHPEEYKLLSTDPVVRKRRMN
jgi:hypothetical protein